MFLVPFRAILFQEQIFKRLSLGAKERRIRADSCQKYEDLTQKYLSDLILGAQVNVRL